MSYSTWEGIADTPWWVYLIMLGFLNIGYLVTKPRFIFVKAELFTQTLAMAILIIGISYIFKFTWHNTGIIFGSMLAGFMLGWMQFYFGDIRAVKGKWIVHIPGSWVVFILMIAIIIAKYYFYGHRFFISLEELKQEKYYPTYLTLSGLAIGLFIGRVHYLLRVVRSGPYYEEK